MYGQNFIWKIYLKSDIYQLCIFCKQGCYDIYILETSEILNTTAE